ncbi:hypothetical protein [Streptomyces sp. NPDC059063]|uniref:hypothetical protein n=1 Tax=unclassified Streptomyces TaxID=2593676 RepID=UPI0036B43697
MRRLPRLRAATAATAATAVVTAAAAGLVACDPVEGDMSTSAIAITTDKMGTRELERQHLEVDWINCTASFVNKDDADDRTATDRPREAQVDCRGKAENDKDITIEGRVTDVRNGACVRGNLVAKVEQKEWFRVDVLGNCEGGGGDDDGDDGKGNDGGNGNGNGGGNDKPVTHGPGTPAPTSTVTVTQRPDPTCDCYPGK